MVMSLMRPLLGLPATSLNSVVSHACNMLLLFCNRVTFSDPHGNVGRKTVLFTCILIFSVISFLLSMTLNIW